MQLTTALHLIALIVPIVVLATFGILRIEPSPALMAALASLGSYAGVASIFGFAKDRIMLRRTGTRPRRSTEAEAEAKTVVNRRRWSQESPVSQRSQRPSGGGGQ